MAARSRTNSAKALRLACWNADGIRGRKLELDHFLCKHGVDICLLTETHIRSGEVFRLANCLPSYSPFYGGRRKSNTGPPGYRPLPVPGLTQLEPTAIHIMLASGPVKIMAVCLSPSRPLIKANLSACLSGGLPVLMVGDLNAKHVDWNSRLRTTWAGACVIMPTNIPV
jgi:hypothetical protein